MASLNAQLRAFKERQANQPILERPKVARVDVDGGGSGPASEMSSPSARKSGIRAAGMPPGGVMGAIYSQPADTGVGAHLLTNLSYAIDYLKSQKDAISRQALQNYLSVPITPAFFHLLRTSPKVTYDEQNDTFVFRPIHDVRSKAQLVARLASIYTGNGILVKELKEGWPEAEEGIADLENEGQVLVFRNAKDGSARMVFYNDKSRNLYIDSQFKALWDEIKVPSVEEILLEMEKQGIKRATNSVINRINHTDQKKPKRPSSRSKKLTNLHMSSNLLRDFSKN